MLAVYTDASMEALGNLRNTAHFQWYLIPLLAFVVYVYIAEVEKKNWDIVLAGITFFGIELAWEMFNALILHFSKRSAMWTTPGKTAYLIFVGLTIEISMMFAVAGVIITKVLPEDKKQKILGVPNRLFHVLVFGIGCALVEVILNQWGVLIWEYPWWRWPNVWLIILAYCVGFALCVLYYDIHSMKAKLYITAAVFSVDIIAAIIFIRVLKWI